MKSYRKVLETELEFLENELEELKNGLRTERGDDGPDEAYLKLMRVYLSVTKRYAELQAQLAAVADPEDDELVIF